MHMELWNSVCPASVKFVVGGSTGRLNRCSLWLLY